MTWQVNALRAVKAGAGLLFEGWVADTIFDQADGLLSRISGGSKPLRPSNANRGSTATYVGNFFRQANFNRGITVADVAAALAAALDLGTDAKLATGTATSYPKGKIDLHTAEGAETVAELIRDIGTTLDTPERKAAANQISNSFLLWAGGRQSQDAEEHHVNALKYVSTFTRGDLDEAMNLVSAMKILLAAPASALTDARIEARRR